VDEPNMVFSTGEREIRVNFGVISGREATAAEIEELARELHQRREHVLDRRRAPVRVRRRSGSRRAPGADRDRGLDRRRASGPAARDRDRWAHACAAERHIEVDPLELPSA
jgi:hypothetical protein